MPEARPWALTCETMSRRSGDATPLLLPHGRARRLGHQVAASTGGRSSGPKGGPCTATLDSDLVGLPALPGCTQPVPPSRPAGGQRWTAPTLDPRPGPRGWLDGLDRRERRRQRTSWSSPGHRKTPATNAVFGPLRTSATCNTCYAFRRIVTEGEYPSVTLPSSRRFARHRQPPWGGRDLRRSAKTIDPTGGLDADFISSFNP